MIQLSEKHHHFDLFMGQIYNTFIRLLFTVKNNSKNVSFSLFTTFTVVSCSIVHFSFVLNIHCSYRMMMMIMMMMMTMMMMIMNCFCGMFNQRKGLSLSPSRDHCRKFSPSQIFKTLRVPDLNLRIIRVQYLLNEAVQY